MLKWPRWMSSLLLALLSSMPLWAVLVFDTIKLKEAWGLWLFPFYILGELVYLAKSAMTGYYDGNSLAVCLLACAADTAVIWLAVYLMMRRRDRSTCTTTSLAGSRDIKEGK
jgi:polyferredoxin